MNTSNFLPFFPSFGFRWYLTEELLSLSVCQKATQLLTFKLARENALKISEKRNPRQPYSLTLLTAHIDWLAGWLAGWLGKPVLLILIYSAVEIWELYFFLLFFCLTLSLFHFITICENFWKWRNPFVRGKRERKNNLCTIEEEAAATALASTTNTGSKGRIVDVHNGQTDRPYRADNKQQVVYTKMCYQCSEKTRYVLVCLNYMYVIFPYDLFCLPRERERYYSLGEGGLAGGSKRR